MTHPAPPGHRVAVDIVVVHYRAHEFVGDTLEPLCDAIRAGQPWSLTVADNDVENPLPKSAFGSDHAHLHALQRRQNDGFGAACNEGAAIGSAPLILFLNPDCRLDPVDLQVLVDALHHDANAVAVGPKIERPDGTPEVSWGHHPGILWEARRRRLARALQRGEEWALAQARELTAEPRTVGWLTGACLLVRREAFDAIGGFDTDYFLYFEDADLCARLEEHGEVRFLPQAQAVHIGGASSGESGATLDRYRASQRLYYAKHRPVWERWALRLWRVLQA